MSKQLAVAELPAGVRGPFEGVFTQVRRADDGKVYWRTTCSDDGVDKWATRMTTDLHEDFIRNAEGLSGMPYLTIAHYNELARIGRATKLYRDGRRLKAEGVFWTDHEDEFTRALATKAADAALAEANLMPRLRQIRTSIGFHPTAAEQEDLGVMAYTRGVLPEIAMTTSPGNSRVDFDAGRSDDMQTRALKPEFMREDASNIVGEEMAEELDRRLKAVIGRSDPNADTLELLYRSAAEGRVVAVETHKAARTVGTLSWDGAATLQQVRKDAGEDWAKYETYFATVNPERRDSHDGYGFLHHEAKDVTLSLAGLIAAGAAATGRSGKESEEAQKHLEPHYAEFDRTAPWKRDRANMAHRLEDIDDLRILQRSGLVEEAAVERAIEDFGAEILKHDLDALEGVEAKVAGAGWEFRTGTLEPVSIALAPLLARVGRRLQGKRLSEMENAIKALSAIAEWAKVEEADNADIAIEPRTVAPALPFRTALKERGMYETEPDDSLIEQLNMQSVREMIFNATYALSDIVCANLETGDDDDPLSLEGRLANVQNATNEYLQVVNALLMSAYGGGRSAPNDNRDEMKPQGTRTDVKPDVQAPGGVKDAGGSDAKPDLQRFEQTVEQLRQHIIDSDPAKVQDALNALVPAIEETMGQPEGTEEMDAILARVAGNEIGISAIQEQLTELLDRMDTRSTEGLESAPRTAYNPPVPRRRGYAPGPPPTTVRSDAEPQRWDGKTPLKIRDVARQSVGLNRYP